MLPILAATSNLCYSHVSSPGTLDKLQDISVQIVALLFNVYEQTVSQHIYIFLNKGDLVVA